ncbi:hypothetical protein [Tenacibaculum sp. 190524A02b]|uniref:hypothetical protein n=1 Tax=Tenacibaculum vairaonense TaxID=3137860 RepID=UPI0031FB0A9C
MVFPLLNISTKKWNSEDINNYIILDKFIYTDKESIFNELYKNKLFIDCNGQIFKAIRKEELTDKWRNWLRFIPNIWKCEIHFKTTGENWTVNQLRNYLLERISDLKPTKHTEKWKSDLMNAKNYTELIYGK